MENDTIEILKVGSKTKPASIAGVIAEKIKQFNKIELQVIGAGSLNQAIKGIAIARGFVAPNGIDLVCYPIFTDIVIDDEKRTGIKLIIICK